MAAKTEHEKRFGVKEFKPASHNPLPWRVCPGQIWTGINDANGKRVCNCRNIKDAELIVKSVNKQEQKKESGVL